MKTARDRETQSGVSELLMHQISGRILAVFGLFIIFLTQVPIVSAHGTTTTGGLSSGDGLLIVLIGIGVIGVVLGLKRMDQLSAAYVLYGILFGIAVTVFGAVLFEGLSADPSYSASTMPFPRSWYRPLALLSGILIMTTSLSVGFFRWRTRPRYTLFGIVMGLWISYPYLIPEESHTHPIGYALVLGTPFLVGYIVWKDIGDELRAVLQDRVARRFGLGVGILLAVFFVSMTGYLSFFPDEGAPRETTVVVLPVIYQLVTWPTLEIALPQIPLFLAISPGQVIIVGMLSTLVGFNAVLIAQHWRAKERAGMTQGSVGSAAIVGTCTCGCCGPLVAKIAILVAGPSIAAPLYWVFVDTASPLSVVFIVGSLLLFTGSLIYSIEAARSPSGSTSIIPSD